MVIDLDSLLHEMVELVGGKAKTTAPASTFKSLLPAQFQSPIKGTYYNSGNFSPGVATDPRHPGGHKGVDLRASGGTAIYPIAAGLVTAVGGDPKGGNVINIQHPNGVRAYYAHLGSAKVRKGDKVGINTVIGTVGNSGNAGSTFPHLHIQVWQNGQLINPGNLFHVPSYTKVDSTKEKVWLSERAKQEAQSFDMKKHVEPTRMAHQQKVDQLLKLASAYEGLIIRS